MQAIITLCLFVSAMGFAPSSRTTSSIQLNMAAEGFSKSVPFLLKPKNLDAFTAANEEFDPLGLAEVWDINFLREAELKHCRVAMLATVGWLVQVSIISESYYTKIPFLHIQ